MCRGGGVCLLKLIAGGRMAQGNRIRFPSPPRSGILGGMVVVSIRIVAVLLGAYALTVAFFASIFRMDTIGELRWVLWADIRIGFWVAIAFLLWRVPTPDGTTWRRHVITGIGTAATWAAVTGELWYEHLSQASIRAQEPMDELVDRYLWPVLPESSPPP
jgi:hypothetical protein